MGFWTDWLDPNDNGRHEGPGSKSIPVDADPRSKLDKLAGVPRPREVFCTGCEYPPSACRCDKNLGRPRKWWE
jgi:hypothetical protein